MKHLFFLIFFFVSLISGYGQGSKFKPVNRTVPDSTAISPFTKDAILIDGSKSPQLRSSSSINPNLSAAQLPQFLDSISRDSLPKIRLKQAEPKSVFIERQRSQLRSVQMMSNEEITRAFFKETPSLKINHPEEQIRIDKIDTDNLGMSHIKGVQLFRNIPVYGMEFTFHISERTERFIGYTADSTQIDTLSARLTAQEAIRIAESDLSQTTEIKPLNDFMKQMLKYEGPTAESIYYPNNLNIYRNSYKIIIRPNMRDEWIYYIDAQSGEIMRKFNNTPTAGPVKGAGTDLKGVQRTVDLWEENGVYKMINTTKSMYNASSNTGRIIIYDHQYNPNMTTLDPLSSTSTQWNHPGAISAAWHTSLTYDYIQNKLNRNSLDNKGMDINCIVNVPDEYGQSYDNAFWNGIGIWFSGGATNFSNMIGGLDCVAHECGHGVTQFSADLEYQYQSGAINETYSDIMGALVDGNFTAGEEFVKNRNNYPTGYMRDMSNPHNGGRNVYDPSWQPAHVSEMYLGDQDNGGVHINSGIGNYAFYLYASQAGMEKAGQIFYRALFNYLTKTSKFVDFRIGVIQAAEDLYGEADATLLGEAFDRVGILEDTGSGKPGDLQPNPGQQGLLLTNANMLDPYGLYKTTDYTTFTPLTYSRITSRPSVTDNGQLAVFIDANKMIKVLDITTGQESAVSTDAGYGNVAISRDGNRIAFVSTQQDAKIYVYDFISQTMAAFPLYNPTTGTGGVQSGGVRFAESLEFDHTGEYVLYDAYNEIGGTMGGNPVSFWDIGMLHVWNNNANTFGSGQIAKLFAMLAPGESIGNPTFSKNSPHIIAFDYMSPNNEFGTYGLNLSDGTLNLLFTNTSVSFPSYSIDDKAMAFASFNQIPVAGYIALGADKISIAGQGTLIANYATFPVYYGTGTRTLGLKPAAAFSADIRSGGVPLEVQYLDLSENKPTGWSWEFEGGVPVVAVTQNPVVYYNDPGTYRVKLTVYNDYGNDFIEKQSYITVSATGIQNIKYESISVYLNPVTDELIIDSGETEFGSSQLKIKKVEIFDVTGKKQFSTINFQFSTINVSSLMEGIYFVRVETEKGSVIRKFVKE